MVQIFKLYDIIFILNARHGWLIFSSAVFFALNMNVILFAAVDC